MKVRKDGILENQPITATSLPLPTGASTSALQLPDGHKVSTKTALTASSPTFATVGVASAEAVATNGSRTGLVLINTSANAISFGLGATAVLNSGITLNASGGTWVMDQFNFTTAAVNAIAGGASSNLAVQEFT